MLGSATLLGCAQTGSYGPKPVTATYRLENFSNLNLQVVVRDLRTERSNFVELISAIQSQISSALAEKAAPIFVTASIRRSRGNEVVIAMTPQFRCPRSYQSCG